MQIDPQELLALAAAEAPRLDLYSGIHKALRALMADTLLAVGRMDTDDKLEVAEVTERVLVLLEVCRSHLQHENDFIHAAIEARHPGGSLFEEKRGVRWRSPLDEDDFVCDASCRELLVVELEGTEEAGREIAAVAIVSSRQDDAEKRRRVQ